MTVHQFGRLYKNISTKLKIGMTPKPCINSYTHTHTNAYMYANVSATQYKVLILYKIAAIFRMKQHVTNLETHKNLDISKLSCKAHR